jgi:3-oxoacyl-[acyl-carrier protein] reductase
VNKNHVLVVGASSAIGCEIIRQTSDDNSVFFAHYHSGKDRLDALLTEVNSRIVPIYADLSLEGDIDSLIESVASNVASPQKIIFVAAPALALTRFKDLTWSDFKEQLDVQLYSAFKILNRFLPVMSREKYGKVVFVLSGYTLGTPPSAMAHYVTAKYALLGLMKSLASEYAGKKICINAISPSMVETNFLANIPEKIVEFTAQQHPLKRNGTPADIAPFVKFLLSEDSAFMTGVNIPVTGGA